MKTNLPANPAIEYNRAYFVLQGSRGGRKAKKVMTVEERSRRALKAVMATKRYQNKHKDEFIKLITKTA